MTHALLATLSLGIAALFSFVQPEPPTAWIPAADAATEQTTDIALDHLHRATDLAFENLDAVHLRADWERRPGADEDETVFVLTHVSYVSELDHRSPSLTPTSVRKLTVTATPDPETGAAPVQVFALVECEPACAD